jgi:hypothetical protein
VEHGSISNAHAGCRVGGIEYCLDLVVFEIAHETGIGLLARDGEDALNLTLKVGKDEQLDAFMRAEARRILPRSPSL